MAINELPVRHREYYKSMKEYATYSYQELQREVKKRNNAATKLHDAILNKKESYKTNFNIDLSDYDEFIENKYINGTLFKFAKAAYFNKTGDYKLISDLYDLYTYVLLQKEIHNFTKKIRLYFKISEMNVKEYVRILRVFYTEVQKQLILEGKGYVFEDTLGWICINRYKLTNRGKKLNFAETKKRKQEFLDAGKRIFNEQEAKWCKERGIEYTGEDYRVWLKGEYQYEIPLLHCHLTNGKRYRFEHSDYRGSSIRGKSNKQLLEECEYDTDKIMELDLDIKTKLTMCLESDKMLYMNFIRTDEQHYTGL